MKTEEKAMIIPDTGSHEERLKAAQKTYKKKLKDKNYKRPCHTYPFKVPPEEISELKRAVAWPQGMSKLKRERIIQKSKESREKGREEAGMQVWGPIEELGKMKQSRYGIMQYIVDMISETAISLPALIKLHEDTSFPTLKEVRTWCRVHPDFERELLEADQNRGELLGEMSLDVVFEAPEDEDPRKTKLKHDALSKHAARLNERYQDKQVQKIEDVTDKMTREDLVKQLKSLASKHQEIANVLPTLEMSEDEDVPGSDRGEWNEVVSGEETGTEE